MLSKSNSKRITGLLQKKYRQREGLFVAEGIKVINELLNSSFEVAAIYGLDRTSLEIPVTHKDVFQVVTAAELKKVSFLKTPQTALALFKIPAQIKTTRQGITVVLDDVRDPGNLGTIIRLCDWFGVPNLICSSQTVDCYNPKVVQATMGSLSRIAVSYTNIAAYLKEEQRPIYGTFMDGATIYKATLPEEAVIVMGNEANGISDVIEQLVTHKIAIPRFGQLQKTESLNVATATAICLSEFKRGTSIER
ncbi:RNA methyltransferase [uncultured Dokdonia sp.]|uniref:TrmH family RNA methyltransferase n=1 Tax=uncultured Dokdonia sp. TaxID=575653 RepID=UPI0026084FA4|nr:RNA methyltransferase [uncultured Dokdonia sp.]